MLVSNIWIAYRPTVGNIRTHFIVRLCQTTILCTVVFKSSSLLYILCVINALLASAHSILWPLATIRPTRAISINGQCLWNDTIMSAWAAYFSKFKATSENFRRKFTLPLQILKGETFFGSQTIFVKLLNAIGKNVGWRARRAELSCRNLRDFHYKKRHLKLGRERPFNSFL